MEKINVAWELVGQFAVALGLIVGLVQGFKYLRSQTSIAKLETKVADQGDKLEKDYRHLEALDTRMNGFEKRLIDFEKKQAEEIDRVNKSLEMLGRSMASMLNHLIDGNGTESMREERDKLVDFFIGKK